MSHQGNLVGGSSGVGLRGRDLRETLWVGLLGNTIGGSSGGPQRVGLQGDLVGGSSEGTRGWVFKSTSWVGLQGGLVGGPSEGSRG